DVRAAPDPQSDGHNGRHRLPARQAPQYQEQRRVLRVDEHVMRKLGAGILAVVAVLVSAAPAFAQEKQKNVYGLSIPDRVGGLVYARTIDVESKSPGLGSALRFGGKPGWMVDVYLYDLGLKTIPSDAESDVIKNQLAQARGDIFELGKRGTYGNVTDKGDFQVPESRTPGFICPSFRSLPGDRVA